MGQYLFGLSIGLPYIALGVVTVAAGVVYLFVHEPHLEKTHLNINNYILGLKNGFHEAFKDSKTARL